MIIAVEGLPATGKTYCLRELMKEKLDSVLIADPFAGKPSLREQYMRTHSPDHRAAIVQKAIRKTVQNIIMPNQDRMVFVENYYGHLIREPWTESQRAEIISYMLYAKPEVLINFTCDPVVAYTRNAWTGMRPHYSLNKFKTMDTHYRQELRLWSSASHVFTLDTTKVPLEAMPSLFFATVLFMMEKLPHFEKPQDAKIPRLRFGNVELPAMAV